MMNIRIYMADQSAEFKKSVYNYFIGSDITIVGDSDDGRIAYEEIMAFKPEFVILDLWLKRIDGAQLIREIKRDMKDAPYFVIITGLHNNEILEEAIEAGASYCISKPCELSSLAMTLHRIALNNENVQKYIRTESPDIVLETFITRLIHKVGIPAHIKGYQYLRTAILMTFNNSDMINSVTKELYPAIAKKYDTTSSRVERAIRHAIEVAWDRGDCDVLDDMFGYTVQKTRGKPTNSEFIAMISDHLRIRYQHLLLKDTTFRLSSDSMLTFEDLK